MEQVPVSSLYQIKEEGQKGKLIRTWKDKKFNLTAKLVCTKCNNEWMSDLENEQAKPVMQCMISQGKRISLSPRDLAAIAAFTFKTAVVFDHMQRERNPFFSPSVRKKFSCCLEIPRSAQMWLSSFCGRFRQDGILSSFYYESKEGMMGGCELYVLTFGLGFFIVQALFRRWKQACERALPIPSLPRDGDWGLVAKYFWPCDGLPLDWPAPCYLDDDTIQAFCDRF